MQQMGVDDTYYQYIGADASINIDTEDFTVTANWTQVNKIAVDNIVTTNKDVANDTADYSYLSSGTGITVNYNVIGENDTILNKGFVTEDGEGGRDTLYGIEEILLVQIMLIILQVIQMILSQILFLDERVLILSQVEVEMIKFMRCCR